MRQAVQVAPDATKDVAPPIGMSGAANAQLLVVRAHDEMLGFRLGMVGEIIRIPRLASMPFTPPSLLGLANLRGSVLPVVSLSRLLGLPDAPLDEAARIVVMADGAPVGFAVGSVETLVDISAAHIVTDSAGAGRLDPSLLDGVVKGAEGEPTVKIVNPRQMLRGAFDRIGVATSTSVRTISTAPIVKAKAIESQRKTSLVSFDLDAQEYALPLDRVREIVALPTTVSEIAGAESAVLGVVTLRDRLLPLVSLRAAPRTTDPDRAAPSGGRSLSFPWGAGASGLSPTARVKSCASIRMRSIPLRPC